jgi:thioredoxin 1
LLKRPRELTEYNYFTGGTMLGLLNDRDLAAKIFITKMAEFIKDESEFESRLATAKVLVVDCTAPWCGPCKLVAPLIDRLAAEYSERAEIFKLDVEPNRDLAKRLGIRNIPAVIFFKAGEKIETIVGVKSYEEFSLAVEKLLT